MVEKNRHKDYRASVACTVYKCMSNRCRVVFVSFCFPPCFHSGIVFLYAFVLALFPSFSSLHPKMFYRKFYPLYYICVQLIHINVFSLWNFRKCSTYMGQDVFNLWNFTDLVTHYVYNHVRNSLKLSAGNYCTWLCSILGYLLY